MGKKTTHTNDFLFQKLFMHVFNYSLYSSGSKYKILVEFIYRIVGKILPEFKLSMGEGI